MCKLFYFSFSFLPSFLPSFLHLFIHSFLFSLTLFSPQAHLLNTLSSADGTIYENVDTCRRWVLVGRCGSLGKGKWKLFCSWFLPLLLLPVWQEVVRLYNTLHIVPPKPMTTSCPELRLLNVWAKISVSFLKCLWQVFFFYRKDTILYDL